MTYNQWHFPTTLTLLVVIIIKGHALSDSKDKSEKEVPRRITEEPGYKEHSIPPEFARRGLHMYSKPGSKSRKCYCEEISYEELATYSTRRKGVMYTTKEEEERRKEGTTDVGSKTKTQGATKVPEISLTGTFTTGSKTKTEGAHTTTALPRAKDEGTIKVSNYDTKSKHDTTTTVPRTTAGVEIKGGKDSSKSSKSPNVGIASSTTSPKNATVSAVPKVESGETGTKPGNDREISKNETGGEISRSDQGGGVVPKNETSGADSTKQTNGTGPSSGASDGGKGASGTGTDTGSDESDTGDEDDDEDPDESEEEEEEETPKPSSAKEKQAPAKPAPPGPTPKPAPKPPAKKKKKVVVKKKVVKKKVVKKKPAANPKAG